ncbi:MAG: hypothetical protein ACKOCT_01145, partial [Alphaproteobacteria bacterium]
MSKSPHRPPSAVAFDLVIAAFVVASIGSVARFGMFGPFRLDDVEMIAFARAWDRPSPEFLFTLWNGHPAP